MSMLKSVHLLQVNLANYGLATPRTATSEIALLNPNAGLWRTITLAYKQHLKYFLAGPYFTGRHVVAPT
jgi:hypothetical protein